ncbi:hypothetical protein Ahy_B05g074868 [Arachis hypogaea]|uniref:Ubiquitin-like protease family profile domain-containing protein n=1 Tax=Arachis hypogaea TaxID=3818 RepID=A0A444Z020_ARAHY|nr:hypothetical protein Ahy_B05g074868 [Arachis hypogaea]
MAHSSTSPSKKTQSVKFRVTFQTKEIELVAKISRNHQQKIELSINNLKKKRRNITQEKMAGKNQAEKNFFIIEIYLTLIFLCQQTKDLKCATHLLSEKFRNMSEEKKAIVRGLGFGGLMHIPPLRELANSFKLGKNTLETGYGSFKVRPRTIGAALSINASGDLLPQKVNYKDLSEDNKQIFRRFQGKTLKNLTDEMMDRLMFKRIFILYIQMAFLLPTTINKISPVHLAPIFKMDTITEGNWGAHVLNFIIKGITDYNLKKKKEIDGCLFALMIVYFHLSKSKDKKGEQRPPEPWIANWTREQLVEKMRAEMEEHMASSSSSSETETTESEVHSTSESETEEDSRGFNKDTTHPKKHNPKRKKSLLRIHLLSKLNPNMDTILCKLYYHLSSKLYLLTCSFMHEKNEKSAAQGEKEADMRSTEGHYVSSETIPDLNLGSDDPSSQGHTDQSSVNKSAKSMLSLVEESATEPAEENMMVVWVETQSQTEALAIVPIQVCLPLSQTTTLPEIELTPVTENEPTPMPEIEPTPEKSPSERNNEGTTKSPRRHCCADDDDGTDSPTPSFSLGFTDSSQEEAATQEGAATQDGERAKTPEIPKLLEQLGDLVEKIASGGVSTKGKSPQIRKESGRESFEKFETPARTNEDTTDMKEKCYIWATRVKTYGNGLTNEYDTVCTLKAQDSYILSKIHLASLAAETHIEAEIVSAMCLILNQQKIKRFQEEVYCLPPDIVPFRVEDYPMFIPFLDLKKLASHRYIFAPVCHSQHWWLWLADTRKRKFYILDPYHTKSPSDERTALNTFIGYVISRIRVYAGGAPLKTRDKDKEIEPPYINISGQKTSYDCAVYVMKWLEIIHPENIKRLKYEWDNWTQDEMDHFRVEYASRILFHKMNQDKAEAIRGSNAIRLSKPSSLLLSPYCQIDSNDIDTD